MVIGTGSDGFYILDPRSKIIFKQKVFFANAGLNIANQSDELSEDGVLVMIEQRRLLIRVRNIDDLENL